MSRDYCANGYTNSVQLSIESALYSYYKVSETGGNEHSLLNPSGIMNNKVVFTSVALVVYLAACLVEVHGIGKLIETVFPQI